MSVFYPSTSAGGQLTLPDMHATDHCGPLPLSVFGSGLGVTASQTDTERSPGSLLGTRAGFPANFLSYSGGAGDLRDFCPPSAAADGSVASAKIASPRGAALDSRHCRSNDYGCGGGLDLTGADMRDVFKTATSIVDQPPPLGSPSSSRHHPHPDQTHQLHHQLRSELLQPPPQHTHDHELFLHQARQWYHDHSPPSSSAVQGAAAADLVNGRSPGAAPPTVFRHDVDVGGGGLPCRWSPPLVYNSPVNQRQHPTDPLHQTEVSPTQKTGGVIGGAPFYPWMAIVGRCPMSALVNVNFDSLYNLFILNITLSALLFNLNVFV